MADKGFKARAKSIRKRWNGEMKFRLGKIPIPIYATYHVFPITKYSPLFEVLYRPVLRMQSGGIVDQIAKSYYLTYIEEKVVGELEPIKLGHMLTGTYGFIVGLFMALVTFAIEKQAKRINKIWHQQN